MNSRLAAAVMATIGLLSVLAVPTPVAAQNDSEAETTETTATAETDGASETETAETSESTETAAPATIAKRGDRGGAVRTLQDRLTQAGFSPGTIDGIFGRRTQAAVTAFQQAVGLEATGIYDSVTAERLASYTPPAGGDTSTETPADSGGASSIMSTREAQQRLTDAGFDPGPVDGLYGRRTRAGLEAFQRHVGIAVTGRVDAATSEALRNFTGSAPTTSTPTPTAPDTSDPDTGSSSLREAQRALANGPFDPGPIDGRYGTKTKNAIWALEKLAGIAMNGQWSSDDQAALQRVLDGRVGGPVSSHSRRWVEVDLSQQLMKVYDPGRTVPVLVSHVSSGSGIPWRQGRYSGRSITPVGNFTIFRRISGWRQSSLGIGSLYNPLYFTTSGIAFHGSRSVPSYPASHGCVRVPMHIAEYLPAMLPNGTPVVVVQ